MTLDISPLRAEERTAWDPLARGYMDFYGHDKSSSDYDMAWSRLMRHDGIAGLGARIDTELIGTT